MKPKSLEKKERALGMKLFLKGERCVGQKCAMVKKPYRPGMHGKRRRGAISEYGQQLLEKQRVRTTYGLKESQFYRVFKEAAAKGAAKIAGSVGTALLIALERRIDNVVFRLGFAPSRVSARQFVNHGHFRVNGKKVTSPSYLVKAGDVISINQNSKERLIFKDLPNIIKNREFPEWLEIDKEKLEGKIKFLPRGMETPFDINLVVDYYSR